MKFGVVIATYEILKNSGVNNARANYVDTFSLLTETIDSIKNQIYKDWKIYIIGDHFTNEKRLKDHLSNLLEDHQYTFYNLDKPGERGRGFTKKELRFTGGVAAMNKGLRMCVDDDIDIIARIDHDDIWTEDHLSTLCAAYTQYPNLAFVFTQGRKKITSHNSSKEYLMMPDKKVRRFLNNCYYVSGATAHSSVSWNPSITGEFFYRDPLEQRTTQPIRNHIQPGDVDMFKRMGDHIKKNNLQYLYIPELTVYHRNRKGEL